MGEATFDMKLGGNNKMTALNSAAISYHSSPGKLTYLGGGETDTLSFGDRLGDGLSVVTFDMREGGTNTLDVGANAAGLSGSISYTGGSGTDNASFGYDLADDSGSLTFDFGVDTKAEQLRFEGSVGDNNGTVVIKNFDPLLDTIIFGSGITDGGGTTATVWTSTSQLLVNDTVSGVTITSGLAPVLNLNLTIENVSVATITLTVSATDIVLS